MSQSRMNVVVLVEDDYGMRQSLQCMLEVSGFITQTFCSAEALLAAEIADHARCLVLDVQLPGMSGFELQRRLRASGHVRPVIFITAHDTNAAREQAEALGAIAYLPKPFAAEALLDAVGRTAPGPIR